MIRQESWILDHFEIFVTIALKGAYGNRWQSEDGDATWRIACLGGGTCGLRLLI